MAAPIDMLRFGLLYLQQGRWEQRQLISRKRLNRSVQPAIPASTPNQGFYGWHWWSNTFGEDMMEDQGWSSTSPSFGFFYARGYAGQFIYIIPDLDIVVTLTDDKRKKERHPSNVFRDFIAPLLLKALK